LALKLQVLLLLLVSGGAFLAQQCEWAWWALLLLLWKLNGCAFAAHQAQYALLLLLLLSAGEGSVHCQDVLLLLLGLWCCWGCVGPEVPGTGSAACLV
jgi:hypothetical protein